MAGKKLEPEDAFHLLNHDPSVEQGEGEVVADLEDGFSQSGEQQEVDGWAKWLRVGLKVFIALTVLLASVGVGVFYYMVANPPAAVVSNSGEALPEEDQVYAPTENEARSVIEKQLRAFLSAETVAERLKFVVDPELEKTSLIDYYERRAKRDSPLWKIEKIASKKHPDGSVWFVVYRDLEKRMHAVSFELVGKEFRLHWSAMKAYCEMPWEKFIIARPQQAQTMRGYIRRYDGHPPLTMDPEKEVCFLVEDRGSLFSELAVMRKDAKGVQQLAKLKAGASHPVTLRLRYKPGQAGGESKLTIDELLHLRWQRMRFETQF